MYSSLFWLFIFITAFSTLSSKTVLAQTHERGYFSNLDSQITGVAFVIDGDTLQVSSHKIRLYGIDAPETEQTCPRRGGGVWSCGEQARLALKSFLHGQEVICLPRQEDVYDRVVATCYVFGQDVGAYMVSTGYAWDFSKKLGTYLAHQKHAKSQRLGVWSGARAQPPWSFRRQRERRRVWGRGRCNIKGNISKRGKIYYMPRSRWYSRVHISKARGERWFCSQAEALRAGWIPMVLNR